MDARVWCAHPVAGRSLHRAVHPNNAALPQRPEMCLALSYNIVLIERHCSVAAVAFVNVVLDVRQHPLGRARDANGCWRWRLMLLALEVDVAGTGG